MKKRNPPAMGGAANPYVLAEYKMGKKIDWHQHSPVVRKQILESALSMPYEKIFSREHKSPVYAAPVKVRRRSKHD